MVELADPFKEEGNEAIELLDPWKSDLPAPLPDGNELNIRAVMEARERIARTIESENKILDTLRNDYGDNISIDGTPFNIQQALDSGASSTQILNSITSGNLIRTDIDNPLEGSLRGGSIGVTNFLGLPGDLFATIPRAIELGGRKTVNAISDVAGSIGTTVSEDPQDFVFSSPNPLLGGQWIRDKLELLGFDYPSLDEFPEEQRPWGQGGRVLGENFMLARLPFTLANMGKGLANPLVQAAKKNPKKLAAQETGAIAVAGLGAGGADYLGFGDNPFVMAGSEIIGSIVGGNPKTVLTTPRMVLAFGKYVKNKIGPMMSKEATQQRALNHILVSANTARMQILDEIDTLKSQENFDAALVEELTKEADAFTPERILADLEVGIKSADEGRPMVRANLPSGTLSDNPALKAIQQKMMGTSEQFNSEVMKQVSATLDSMMLASDLMARAGNTEAADVLRKQAFQQQIDATLYNATSKVAERMKALSGADNFRASKLAQKTLFSAKDNMRIMETYLWERIDNKLPLSGEKLGEAIQSINKNKLLDGMTIAGGGQIDTAIQIISDKIRDGIPISTGEMLKFRSIMLGQARKAAGADDFAQAGIFDALATAAVQDLSKITGEAGDAINAARAFSSELNARFTRYFPQEVLSKEPKGGTTIRSEEVLSEAYEGGGDRAALQFEEMQTAASDATTFADDVSILKARDEAAFKARSLQDNDVRSNVPAAPADGPYDPNKVQTMPTDDDIIPEVQVSGRGRMVNKDTGYFDVPSDPDNPIPEYTIYDRVRRQGNKTNKNGGDAPVDEEMRTQPLNEVFVPGSEPKIDLGADMFNAQEEFIRSVVYDLKKGKPVGTPVSAEEIEVFVNQNSRLLERFPNIRTELGSYVDAERTAARLVEDLTKAGTGGNLVEAIADSFTSNNPLEEFSKLANEAQGLPDAMLDFRLASMDVLFKASRNADGSTNFLRLANNMGKPLSGRTGDLTIVDLMVRNNVISPEDQVALGEMVAQAVRIEASLTDPTVFNQVIQETPDIQKNMARIVGANLGVMFGRGDASLQAAAIGSAYVKRLVDQLPLAKDKAMVEALMKNPVLLKEVLSKNPTIAKTGLQTAKEFIAKYRNVSVPELAGQAALALGDATALNTRTSTVGAIQPEVKDEEPPVVMSLDEQMMDLR